VARMSTRLAGRTVPMTLMLPASLVRAGLSSTSGGTQPADPALLRRQIEQSPIELALRLATRTVRPDDVLSALAVVGEYPSDVVPLLTRLQQGPLDREAAQVGDPLSAQP